MHAGYPGDYVAQELYRYLLHEETWMEGSNDYRQTIEKQFGEAIAFRTGQEV